MMGWLLLVLLACLLFAHSTCAWQLPRPQIRSVTAAARHRSPRSTTTLKFGEQSELVEFLQKKSKASYNAVEDFDKELADEIQDALMSAGVDATGNVNTETLRNEQPAAAVVPESKSNGATQINNEKQTRAPIQTKAPKTDTTPPHTNLAQVMANQLNIDLSRVTPSPGKKITASDVEYYAWKLSQPPSTPDALVRAYQIGLDLNTLYDDEDGGYIMQLSDVQLYEENSRSLQGVIQKRRGASNVNSKTNQRKKKLSALEERMEKRMEILAQKLGNVADGIAKTVKLQTSDIRLDIIEKKDEPEIKSVEDFDAALALEIQEALMSADTSNDSNEVEPDINSTKSSLPITNVESEADVELDNHEEDLDKGKMPQSSNGVDLAAIKDDLGSNTASGDIDADAEIELQTINKSMTVADIKDELRTHGVKASGNKSELAKRLRRVKRLQSMTVEQLKHDLREQGLKVGGKKAELVERLIFAEESEKESNGSFFFVDAQ